jgi:predicted esterase
LLPLVELCGIAVRGIGLQAARGVWDGSMGITGYTWFGNQQLGKPEPASFGDSLAQVEHFIYETANQPAAHRPILLGLGQGAVVALAESILVPDFLCGVIAIGGYLPEIEGWSPPLADVLNLPILMIRDPANEVPAELVERSIARLTELHARVELKTLTGAFRLDPAVAGVVSAWHRALAT